MSGYKIIAFFYPKEISNDLLVFQKTAKHGFISKMSDLKKIMDKEDIDILIFAVDFLKDRNLAWKTFFNLSSQIQKIDFYDFYEFLTDKVCLEGLNEAWFSKNAFFIEKRIENLLKNIFDFCFSVIGLFFLIFLFPIIFLAIKIDSSGSVFYTQKRVGKNGKIFTLFKFRTMKVNAEANGAQWATESDPRITRVGSILRRFNLDELPQFLNILKGEMSFVGPRPERPKFVIELKQGIPFYELRHLVKPGLTGWAQTSYQYAASFKESREKLKYDFYYLKHRSFFLDISIIFKTIRGCISKLFEN